MDTSHSDTYYNDSESHINEYYQYVEGHDYEIVEDNF